MKGCASAVERRAESVWARLWRQGWRPVLSLSYPGQPRRRFAAWLNLSMDVRLSTSQEIFLITVGPAMTACMIHNSPLSWN